jgi:hypothetical protein
VKLLGILETIQLQMMDRQTMQFNRGSYQLADAAFLESGDYPDSERSQSSSAEDRASFESVLPSEAEPVEYRSQFTDCMEMSADATLVTAYFDAHQDWFQRCAHPMRVKALSLSAYEMTIGRFGALGYEVEPKLGLNLLPQDQGSYRITTVPISDHATQGYSVDFQATMHLLETPADQGVNAMSLTRVEWDLDLTVTIQFPRFIYRLPKPMIQTTGDRLLRQIVRQVSRRLTYKVQEDFHTSLGLTLPKGTKKPWLG